MQITTCPACPRAAEGPDQIQLWFGYRNIGNKIIPQSYCRACRALHAKLQRQKLRESAAEAALVAELGKSAPELAPAPKPVPAPIDFGDGPGR